MNEMHALALVRGAKANRDTERLGIGRTTYFVTRGGQGTTFLVFV